MFGSRILLPGMLAFTLCGQSANNAVPNPGAAIDQAVRGIAHRSLTASNFSLLPRPLPPSPLSGRSTKCAVPLLEMRIPADKNFVIGQLSRRILTTIWRLHRGCSLPVL
jgi:hypothetical protein